VQGYPAPLVVVFVGVLGGCSSVMMITSTADCNIQNLAVVISDLFCDTERARADVRHVYTVEICLTV
jgi:uncharacterized protein YceK